MPRLTPELKNVISSLTLEEIQKLIFRFARSNKDVYDFLVYEYVNNNNNTELFEKAKEKIGFILLGLSGRIIQKQLAKAIGKSIQEINRFAKITKDKKLEADLLMFLLKIVFKNYGDCFGTCWTVFDSKVGITTNRLLNLVTKKLHYDYQIEYREDINGFIKRLRETSGHIDTIFNMSTLD